MKFGEKIKTLRKERGLTIRQLAIKSGVNIGTIGQLENGSRPSYLTITKLAKGLEIDFQELWKLKDSI